MINENKIERAAQEHRFKGKAIYQPRGAAREYSPWACNLYNGCTNRCDYCYNRHSRSAKVLGADVVTLKKSLCDETRARIYFKRELNRHIEEIRKAGGLFFSFVSDPMLPETIDLTTDCIVYAAQQGVNVQILTKQAAWVTDNDIMLHKLHPYRDRIAVGFTLTGMDEQEHGRSNNFDRVEAMHRLYGQFRTFASIEPVIDINKAVRMVSYAEISCDLFKDIEECWQEMQEHEPFGWLINKADGRYIVVKAINEHGVEKAISKGKLGRCLSDIMKVYSFADGTPFGIKEEK